MSVSVTISGEIIESQNYLSNYFVTINSDQTIYGTKTFNIENVSSMNVSTLVSDILTTTSLFSTTLNASTLNSSTMVANDLNSSILNANQINTSTLDVYTLTIDGIPFTQIQSQTQIFGTSDIDSNLVNGNIEFGKTFDLVPSVVISQYSIYRIVPICVTNVTTSGFDWAASSNNIGKINWSAGVKY